MVLLLVISTNYHDTIRDLESQCFSNLREVKHMKEYFSSFNKPEDHGSILDDSISSLTFGFYHLGSRLQNCNWNF